MHSLYLASLFALLLAYGALGVPAPAPQVTVTATIPGAVNPTLTITISTQTTTTTTTTSATIPTTTATSTQDQGGSAVTTSTTTTQTTAVPTPWVIVLPGYGNVTRHGDDLDGQQQSISETTTTTTASSEPPFINTQTLTLTISDIPVVTATITVPQRPTPTVGARKLRRRQAPTTTTTATQQQDGAGGQATATATATGDSIFAYGQAFLFAPPTQEQAADPYAGPFSVFRAENLTVEQEQRLANRSYYFKGQPYSGQAQVQLAANQSTPASDPAVFDIPPPQSPLIPKQLAWQSPEKPRIARKALPVTDQNGVLIVNTPWTGLPGGFISVQPVQGLLGSVLMPYQVAPLNTDQQPVPSPKIAGVSYLVLEPQNTQERQSQVQQGGQQPAPIGSGTFQGGFVPRQIEALRQQAVIDKHMAVISDIDDVLKETRVSNPRQALLNTFVQEYAPIPGMPNLFQSTLAQPYANTSTALTFHYVSGTPIPLAPSLLQFVESFYPPGSLTLRPTTSFDPQSFINAVGDAANNEFRRQAHVDILHTYSDAQAVIFGDTASRTFQTYVRLVEQFPGRIACVYLRNLTAVEPGVLNPLTRLTREQAVDQVRQVLPQDLKARAEQMVVPFVDPGELLGMNLTVTPAKCA